MTTTVTPTRLATSVPHLPGRLPLLGDVRGLDVRAPIQSLIRMAGEIGPAFERKMFNRRIVLVTGAELAAELSDEARFEKFIGPALWNLRDIGGDGLFGALRHSQRRTFLKPPYVGDLLWRRAERRNLERLRYMNELVDAVIRERVEHPHADADDLLELMLRAARAGGPGALSEVNIRYQIITFLVAGHETTSGALSFALYYLSKHPEVLAEATAEVDRVWGAAERPAFEQVAKLRYVRRVLDEAMRLWPTAPVYGRAARADTVLGGRYAMKAGEGVLVVIPAVHRDPDLWGPDALEFDPDRFTSERVKSRP